MIFQINPHRPLPGIYWHLYYAIRVQRCNVLLLWNSLVKLYYHQRVRLINLQLLISCLKIGLISGIIEAVKMKTVSGRTALRLAKLVSRKYAEEATRRYYKLM